MFNKRSNVYKLIDSKISQIETTLKSLPFNPHDISLMGGETGKALFFLYRFLQNGNPDDLSFLIQILSKINYVIQANDSIAGSLSQGLSGYGWMLSQIKKFDVFTFQNEQVIFDLLDIRVQKFATDCLSDNNFDYLHGVLGCTPYLFSRRNISSNDLVLKQIIAGLKKFAIIDNGQYSWYMNEKLRGAFSANTVNLGVAHGLPSILKFLSTCFKYQIDPVNSKQMAVGTTLKIQSSYQDFSLFGSCFPTVIDEQVKNSKSRLGWCYGDLGISYLLFTSGIDLNDSTVMNYAIDVLKLQTTRKSARQESVLDAGLCHGTSGIALIFEQIYRATKIYSFRQSAKFWIDETLDLSKFSDGLAGFKTIKKTTESNYILSSGFLEGISGTGLALISAISQRPQLWTEILLLNN